MAVIKFISPKFKPDQASMNELELDWPIISLKLTNPNPGLLSAFRGWILTEYGRNVREENRALLLFVSNSYAGASFQLKQELVSRTPDRAPVQKIGLILETKVSELAVFRNLLSQ
ncbi:hypothetical protein PENANT_c094G05793 [Penicillium antarcticum]|uniref:Uncharacterized protein n=1 Tax=Penicillium antarcticum TaxID=416450 RepID=A0A1V6PLZ5_9EURO|nr:hypothetical protein PENANT_c094G05793 [Penicillium antarcticum]